MLLKITVFFGKLKFIAVLCDESSKVYKGRGEHPWFSGIRETSTEEMTLSWVLKKECKEELKGIKVAWHSYGPGVPWAWRGVGPAVGWTVRSFTNTIKASL